MTLVVAPYLPKEGQEPVLSIYRKGTNVNCGVFCYEETTGWFRHIDSSQLNSLRDLTSSFPRERIKKGLSHAENMLRYSVRMQEDYGSCQGVKRSDVDWKNVKERLLLLSLTLFNHRNARDFALKKVRAMPGGYTVEDLARGIREYRSVVEGIEISENDALNFVANELVMQRQELKCEPFPRGGGIIEERLVLA